MKKSSIYLPDELDTQLSVEAAALGVSKADLIRQAIVARLAASTRPKSDSVLPVFSLGRSLTAEEIDDEVYGHIAQQAARR